MLFRSVSQSRYHNFVAEEAKEVEEEPIKAEEAEEAKEADEEPIVTEEAKEVEEPIKRPMTNIAN